MAGTATSYAGGGRGTGASQPVRPRPAQGGLVVAPSHPPPLTIPASGQTAGAAPPSRRLTRAASAPSAAKAARSATPGRPSTSPPNSTTSAHSPATSTGARTPNRRHQSRTVVCGTPSPAATGRNPAPAATRSRAAPITQTTSTRPSSANDGRHRLGPSRSPNSYGRVLCLFRTPASCPPPRVRPKSALPFPWSPSSASHAGNTGSPVGGGRLAGRQPLDDPQLEPVVALELESLGAYLLDRAASKVLAAKRDGDQLQQPLDRTDRPGRAGDVVGQQQQPAGAQHPPHLGDGLALVGDAAQREGAHHGVERAVRKLQRVGVPLPQVHRTAELQGSVAGALQHGGAEVDPGQPDVVGIGAEVQAGADRDLQDVAAGLLADPRAGVAEQVPVEEPHLPVVVGGVLVPVVAKPRGVAGRGRHCRSHPP